MIEFAVRMFLIGISSFFLLVCVNIAIKEFIMREHTGWKVRVIFHILDGIVFLTCLILLIVL